MNSGESPTPRRVRHADIARRAGVSRTTVSYVLSNRSDISISEAVRQRVLDVAAELAYQRNDLARSLASGKTRTIGVLVPMLESTFLAEVVNGLEAVCADNDYRILLGYSRNDLRTEQNQFNLMLQRQVDGIVYVAGSRTAGELDRWLPQVLKQNPRPCVVVDHQPGSRLKVDYLISDDQTGALSAVNHLIGLGHRRIGHISLGSYSSPAMDRLQGYRTALEAAGIPFSGELVFGTSFGPAGGAAAMSALLNRRQPPTAVFAASDDAAAGALQVIRSRGLRVPQDIALVGFNDVEFAQFLDLSTVSRSPTEMGKQAMLRLLERIGNSHLPPEGIVLPTRLIVRGSSAGVYAEHEAAAISLHSQQAARSRSGKADTGVWTQSSGESTPPRREPPAIVPISVRDRQPEQPEPRYRVGGSRHRFFTAVRHERPDRVPLDLWARRETIERLRQFLETDDERAALGVDFAPWVAVPERFPEFDRKATPPRGGFWPGAALRYVWHDDRTFEDAWGVVRRVGEDGKLLGWISGPLANAQNLDEFPFPAPHMLARPEELAGEVELLKASDQVVTTEVWMPFKRAWHLRGMENLLCDMLLNFDFVDALYDKIYAFETERAVRAAQAGIDVIKVVGDIAMEDRLMFPPEIFRRLDVPRLREMIRRVRAAKPDVLMLYHSDGDISAAVDDLIEVGFDIINSIQPECMDPYKVKERWGRRVTLWGTIGVRTDLPRATPESIRALVHERIRRCGHDGGLVLAPANAISYDTPVENIVAMFDAAREFTWED